MMAFNLNEVIKTVEDMGIYDVLLPFLLVFTILFGILQKAKIFGEESKKFNVIIAFVIALLVVRVPSIVGIFNTFLPRVSLVVLVIISALILLGIFGLHSEGFKGSFLFGAVIFSIFGIIWALAGTALQLNLPPWLRLSASDKGWLLGLAAFILIIYFITRESTTKFGKLKKGMDDLEGELGRKR